MFLCSQKSLADEVKDRTICRRAHDRCMQHFVEGLRDRTLRIRRSGAFDQLSDSALVCERIGHDGKGDGD